MVKVLAIDVSGNFKEGKGTSGLCFMEDGEPIRLDEIKATDFDRAEKYWQEHVLNIIKSNPDVVVMEGYRLYNHKGMAASTQANSELETPQLIGVIKYVCHERNIPLVIQFASEIKSRWSEDVLVSSGILAKTSSMYYFNGKRTSTHKRDALKHALHYWRYKHGKS